MIHNSFTFLALAYPGCPEKAVNLNWIVQINFGFKTKDWF